MAFTCRQGAKAEFIGARRNADFVFPQILGLQAYAHAIALARFTHIELESFPFLVGRHMPASRADIVIFALYARKIELCDGMIVVKIGHAHGHRPVVHSAVGFAVVVFIVVAITALELKTQVFGKPALVTDLHRLVHATVAFILKVGHFFDMRKRCSAAN